MRSVTKVAAGGGLGSALTIGALFAAGAFTGGAAVVADPLAGPAAAADGLIRFEDCDELLDWYIDHAVDEVGPYGWGGPDVYFQDGVTLSGRMPMKATAGNLFDRDVAELRALSAKTPGDGEQGNSDTGTNTQEASVDEPDTAKTDGELVVRLVDRDTLVITDVSGDRARELNRVTLPGQTFPTAELLLIGDRVVVVAGESWVRQPRFFPVTDSIGPGDSDGTKVFEVDVSDPAAPVLTHVDRYSGTLVAARQYDDTLRLITQDGLPDLGFHQPGDGVSREEATERNQELVRESTIEDWLPEVTTAGRTTALVGCDEVLHPRTWSGHGTAVVSTFQGREVAARSSVAVAAYAQLAYSSADRIYLAAAQTPDAEPSDDGGEPRVLRKDIPRTDLHAFALDGRETSYVASGTIAGQVRDRWSLDSYDGVLRVAWTRQSSRGRERNGLITMKEEDGRLVRIGQVRGLGVNEQIQSVRWFDEVAVIVTFRRIDPLYAIDLSDPAAPVARGELKVPGYSGYLHPIGDNRILGLGVDADIPSGRTRGAQAATFDIGDLTDPEQLGRLLFGDGTELPALADPRGFTWLPDRRTGVTSVSDWRHRGSRLVAVRVADDGELSVRELMKVKGWQTRALPLDDGRIAVIDIARHDDLRIVDLD